MEEIWRDIKDYEGLYQVSNFGRVKSLGNNKTRKEKILSQTITYDGYLRVHLSNNGKKRKMAVHRLVAQAFLPNPDNLPQVNHKDENPQNNTVWINEDGTVDYEKSNLEWCTNKYNANYGVRSKKISVALSKTVFQYDLNNNLIKEWLSAREIKRVLGFSQQTICDCCNGKINNYKGFIWKYR